MTQVMRVGAELGGGSGGEAIITFTASSSSSCLRRALLKVGTRVSQPISRYALLKAARFSDYLPVMNELAALMRRANCPSSVT